MISIFSIPQHRQKLQTVINSWIGTPYWHQVAVKKRGADCILFIVACLEEAGFVKKGASKTEYYARDWHIFGTEEFLLNNIKKNTNKLLLGKAMFDENAEIPRKRWVWGDILLFSTTKTGLKNHAAFYLEEYKIAHSLQKKGVCISPLRIFKESQYKCLIRICL